MPNNSVVIPSTFSLDMWNYHMMVQQGLPRTTNVVEGWHKSFSAHVSCHHPSIWTFLNVLKEEQGLVEVKQAFYLTGRVPPKRKSFADREELLKTLVNGYLTAPRWIFFEELHTYSPLTRSPDKSLQF